MHLKEFYINNFRGYRKFRLIAQKNTNILTGVNNSGKTTILEAISLWNEIFNYLIVKAQRGDNQNGIKQGDFRFGKKGQNYFDYRSINSVRSFGYSDIFFKLDTKVTIEISAIITLPNDDNIEIGFIMKEANGNNYNVFLKNHDSFNFRLFNDHFPNLPSSIGCYFSSPVATISSYEEFALKPKIREGIKTRESFLYFRNRLYDVASGVNFDKFKTKLSNILYNDANSLEFRIRGDKSIDINISVDVNLKNSGFKNISLLGSGTIQIIEILLHVFESKKELNIILLDEPDSHIHRDIQKRLLKELTLSDTQVFLTTHNESLIRSANPKNIFFIDETVSNINATEIKPIGQTRLTQRLTGISTSYHSKIINKIGSETSLDILNAIEADKILFVEGVDDSEYIQKILDINKCNKECVFWSFGGLDKLISKIKHYQDFFEGLGCNQSLWDKCSIIIDADHMTNIQKDTLKRSLSEKLSLPVFIWSSYTIESTLVTEKPILEQLVLKLCAKNHITKSIEEISLAIDNSIQLIIDNKLDLLNNNEDFGKKIIGQIKARLDNLNSQLRITKVFTGNEINLYNHYRLFAVSQLNINRIDHICNKKDIESLLNNIFN
jgi:AAA15 family ATPase/GTPase